MTRYINREVWKAVDGIILEPNAEFAVKSQENLAIIAGPGAGKTELLAQRACYLLQTNACDVPQKILAISFKVDAADNLKKRVEKRIGPELAKRFESRTFDSFSKSLLDRFRLSIKEEYCPPQNYSLIFNERDIGDIARSFLTERHPTIPNWQHVINFNVLYKRLCNNSLPLTNDDTDIYDWIIGRVWKILIHGKNTFQSSLTFPMITRLAEFILRTNPILKAALQCTYSHVFLDEFQDTTYSQYDLLKVAFSDSKAILTAVGDDKQRIMGWANAMANAFGQFSIDFGANKIELMLNHRSAPILVEIQNILAKSIKGESVSVKSSDKWKAEDGLCQVWRFSNHVFEAKYVAREVYRKISNENLCPRDICVLVKQQEHIYAKNLMIELETLGIHSRIEKEYQDLLAEECIELVVDIIKLVSNQQSPGSWQRTVQLLIVLNGLDVSEDIEELTTLENQLQEFLDTWKFEFCIKQANITEATLFLGKFIDSIMDFANINKIRNTFPKYLKDDYFKDILKKCSQKLAEAYIKHFDWSHAVNEFLGDYSVPIMTIHKSKGLEYNTVYFLGLEDDAFWSFSSQRDADMCAFFVALSRAKQEVIFTFSDSREILQFRELRIVEQNNENISTLYQMLSKANVEVLKLDA